MDNMDYTRLSIVLESRFGSKHGAFLFFCVAHAVYHVCVYRLGRNSSIYDNTLYKRAIYEHGHGRRVRLRAYFLLFVVTMSGEWMWCSSCRKERLAKWHFDGENLGLIIYVSLICMFLSVFCFI